MKKKFSKKTKIFIAFVIVLAVLALALVFLRKKISSKNALANVTYTVRSETYENVIEISGTVSAAQSQSLQALSSGTVVGVYVQQGDYVKKGDLLVQLDDTTQQYNLAQHDYNMATKKINGSAKEIELMETQRLALVQKINECKVTATFDGVIANLKVSVGDSLAAKDSIGTLVDVSYLTAEVEVTETDVAKLQEGLPVEFTFPAYDGIVNGYVVGWPAMGEVTNRGATVVKVKLRIDEYPDVILPNFSFSGEIKVSPDENYVLVERYAVAQDKDGAYVELARTGERIAVTVQNYDSTYVEILTGLSGGEVLKAQSQARASGMNRNNANRTSSGGNGARSSGNSQGGGAPGGGAGGPPGGF